MTPNDQQSDLTPRATPTKHIGNPPLFTMLACIACLSSLSTPRLLLMLPVMAAVGCGVTGFFKKERWGFSGLIAAGLAVCILFLSAAQLAAPSGANLAAVQLVNWNWVPDPSFGTHGTIKWNVEVKNVSSRPIAKAKVDFATYNASGKLLTSQFTFVDAIPPGESRSEESFADLYGNEATAAAKISEVQFSD